MWANPQEVSAYLEEIILNEDDDYPVTLQKKWSFLLRISSVNVTKSAGNCGFGQIYERNA